MQFCRVFCPYLKTPLTTSPTSTTSTSTIKPSTEPSEPTTNPTMITTTQVTTTTKTTTTTTRKSTTFHSNFEFGKIYKITTKTHDSDKAAMGNGGSLDITICGYVKCETLYCLHRFTKLGINHWYFVTKFVLTTVRKKNSNDREKLLKFEVEGREFAKF